VPSREHPLISTLSICRLNVAVPAFLLTELEGIQQQFKHERKTGKKIALADLNVLAGGTAVEQAARNTGVEVQVPFGSGRMDATQAQTDVESFKVLEPVADAFRNYAQGQHGVFTKRPGTLSNDFFVSLLDMRTPWKNSATEGVLKGSDHSIGALKWTGTVVDMIFGSNSQLRALAEVYAADGVKQKFVQDFVAAWVKVTNLDRFDLK
jgi:catalase-peroxidase